MGQTQNKYHITDEGKIYEVNADGSVNALGHVAQLHKETSGQLRAERAFVVKHSKIAWILAAILAATTMLFGFLAYMFREEKQAWYLEYIDLQNRVETFRVEVPPAEEWEVEEVVIEEAVVAK